MYTPLEVLVVGKWATQYFDINEVFVYVSMKNNHITKASKFHLVVSPPERICPPLEEVFGIGPLVAPPHTLSETDFVVH